MNERERLLAVFKGEKPDIIPWYPDLSWWYDGQKKKGKLYPEYEGEEGYLKVHKDTGAGIYLYPPSVWKEEFGGDIKISELNQCNNIVTVISTPIGGISTVKEYMPGSFTTAIREYYIKKPEDLKIMRYIFSHRSVAPNFHDFKQIDSLWNGWGIPCLLAPICVSPLQTLITRWAGIEMTVSLFMEAKEELELTISELERNDDKIFQIITESPAQLIILPENLSGNITGRDFLERYEIPYWQERIRELHEAHKFVALHNDGTLRESLPLLIDTELDIVEAITPAPFGDLTLEEIKEISKGRIIIWGCLPGVLFSPVYPEDYFKRYLREVLKTFPVGSRFVLGVADQVPPDAELSRICMVRSVLEEKNCS